MNIKIEYWIQQKRGFGDWFDYSQKRTMEEVNQRIYELNKGKEEPDFRGLFREIFDCIQGDENG